MTIQSHFFGTHPDGRTVTRYHLTHSDGIEVQVTDYGATLLSIVVPDQSGRRTNVILAYDSLEKYQRQTSYGGGIVGRFANRIRNGQFAIQGKPYQVTPNTPPHHLHGGKAGFDRRLWHLVASSEHSVTLEYVSPDGEEGYPGTLTARATYTLTDPFTLRLDLTATTDQPTIVNLTAHPYFNLAGEGDILSHRLTIPADHFTPVDEGLIPTGELQSVADSPFDFRTPTPIGARINSDHPQLRYGSGYDHNFVLKTAATPEMGLAARLSDPASGRTMDIHSTQPGIQFYSGNFLANDPEGGNGRHYFPHCGVALEPQGFPDAPNHSQFPSALVTPEMPYQETITFTFG
jgi:aldose 1-epimerase